MDAFYRQFLFIKSFPNDVVMLHMLFQQWTTIVAEVLDVLEEHIQYYEIDRGYLEETIMGTNWPPYSQDLNPCDTFLWGHLKDEVYYIFFRAISELKIAIQT